MQNHHAIQVQGLHKRFGEIQAVQDVSFDVAQGEIFSLLGPNGAGKSTTVSMLTCLLEPNAGDALVMGHSIRRETMAVRSAIGAVPQEIALYGDLSARENLAFWGKMYGLRGAALRQRTEEVLEIIGLADRQKGVVGKYSGGMKRRLNVGIALLHRPQVLILDEPTVGIDPQSRRHIFDNVKELNRQGMTVLYTTHYMEEAQELSDRIAIMDQGRLIAQGSHDELVQTVGELDRVELTINTESEQLIEAWRATEGVHQVQPTIVGITSSPVCHGNTAVLTGLVHPAHVLLGPQVRRRNVRSRGFCVTHATKELTGIVSGMFGYGHVTGTLGILRGEGRNEPKPDELQRAWELGRTLVGAGRCRGSLHRQCLEPACKRERRIQTSCPQVPKSCVW